MAEETVGSIEIDGTPAEIMEVVSEYESYPEWTDITSAEVLATDGRGRGTEVAFEVSMMGFAASYTLAYRYRPRNGGVAWTTVAAEGAVRDIRGEYVLEGRGPTTVTYRLAVELAVPVPGIMRRRGEKRVVRGALEGLKRRVEGR